MSERRPRIVIRDLAKTFREGGREAAAVQDVAVTIREQEFVAIVGPSGCGLGYLIIQSPGTLNAADMMVALISLGVIGIVMALAIKQLEMRLRWRPEYRG